MHVQGIIHSLEIAQNHVLCAIRKKTGDIVFQAAPLSLLFAGGHSSVIRQYDDSTLSLVVPNRIRSEDVFIYVSPIPTPGFINGEVVHSTIELVSVCTSSWKFPDLREPEALAALTLVDSARRLLHAFPTRVFTHFEFSNQQRISYDFGSGQSCN